MFLVQNSLRIPHFPFLTHISAKRRDFSIFGPNFSQLNYSDVTESTQNAFMFLAAKAALDFTLLVS